MKVLVLSEHDVEELLTMEECIAVMEDALAALARGEVHNPLRQGIRAPGAPGLLGLMATIVTRAPLHTLTPQTDLRDALRLLVERSLNQLPVMDADRPVGLLTRADLLRYMQLRDELPLRQAADRPAHPPAA